MRTAVGGVLSVESQESREESKGVGQEARRPERVASTACGVKCDVKCGLVGAEELAGSIEEKVDR